MAYKKFKTTKNIQIGTLIEHFDEKVDLVLEQFGTVNKKLDKHEKFLNEHTEKLDKYEIILTKNSETLENHSKILKNHSEILKNQSEILKNHGKVLEGHGKDLKDIKFSLKNKVDRNEFETRLAPFER